MKFFRSILPLIGLLLMGWALAVGAGSSQPAVREAGLPVTTIDAAGKRVLMDHVTDGFDHSSVQEAVVVPTVSHQTPPVFVAIIPLVWMLINSPTLIRPNRVSYYFFAYFRRLFGNQIAINAP